MRKKDTEEFSRKITNIDPLLWLIPLMLSGLGILMITSTTSPLSFELTGTPFAIGLRQLLWLAISIVSMLVAYSLSSSSWKKISGLMWCIAFVLVVASAIPGVGTSVGEHGGGFVLPGYRSNLRNCLFLPWLFICHR